MVLETFPPPGLVALKQCWGRPLGGASEPPVAEKRRGKAESPQQG